ncbi:MAG: hypothetical protein KBD65_04135 [Candidatus Moranbacteria bacterium]|nr:hypothetical protein [Candidatus Moranbacteria bacterium]
MEENKTTPTEIERYAATLKNVTDMFESCGCQTELKASSPAQALLTIRGPVSMCPKSIFDQHVEEAKDLMRSSHSGVSFEVGIEEVE